MDMQEAIEAPRVSLPYETQGIEHPSGIPHIYIYVCLSIYLSIYIAGKHGLFVPISGTWYENDDHFTMTGSGQP